MPLTQSHDIKQALQKYFGFDGFKGEQEDIIRNVLEGRDGFVIMPTGGGKSLCYQLPALMLEGDCHCSISFDRADEESGGLDPTRE